MSKTSSTGATPSSAVVQVVASRNLMVSDDGKTLEVTATSITLTVPAGLPTGFACAVIPYGTGGSSTTVASDGTALLNGATTTLTRDTATNTMFAIVARASAADSYVVTGY